MKKVFLILGMAVLASFQVTAAEADDFEGSGPYKTAKGEWVKRSYTHLGHDVYGCDPSTVVCYRTYENGAFVAYSGGNVVLVGDTGAVGPAGSGGSSTIAWEDLEDEFDGSLYDLVHLD